MLFHSALSSRAALVSLLHGLVKIAVNNNNNNEDEEVMFYETKADTITITGVNQPSEPAVRQR